MPEGITVDLFTNAGAVGMLAIVVWMIFTGRLVTRREADEIRAERDYWREAFNSASQHASSMMETGLAARDVLRALPVSRNGEGRDD